MKKTLRTAVIGAGNMGRHHARVYSEISTFVAVADLKEDIGRPIAEKYHAAYYKSYTEMLDTEHPDAVSVVVPTPFHRAVAEECLKRKIPTLVEKPIADTMEDGKAILDATKKYRTPLMVGHIERFNPAIIKLKQIIEQGKIGDIISLVALRVGISFPNIKDCDVLVDLGIHDIDIFNFLLDEVPRGKKLVKHKIFKNNKADSASIMLEYKKATGLIQTNWITPVKRRALYVTGTDGFAEVDYIRQRIVLYDKHMDKKKDGDFFEFVSIHDHQPHKEVFVSKKEPLKEELIYFLKSAESKVNVDSTYALDALAVLIT